MPAPARRPKLVLAIEALAAYGEARRLMRRSSLPDALERLRAGGRGSAAPMSSPPESPERLARATQRTLRLLPTDTRCLFQSLTLTALLARRGLDSTLVIGVRPGEEFGAHAWVELDGRPLLPGGGEVFQRLVEL